uniref:Uncharacterized protein n=1 Tax=Quercus lobata TaxID=97700 RepID=A0A7N2RAK1_QUELO
MGSGSHFIMVETALNLFALIRFSRRLELKGNKYVLGEFLDFKGKQEDNNALKNIRRSKVCRLIIQKTSMFGLGARVLYLMVSD